MTRLVTKTSQARAHTLVDRPPSTAKTWPVTYDAAGEARNTAAPPSSSGSARRLIGVRSSTHFVNAASASNALLNSVAKIARRQCIHGHARSATLGGERPGDAVQAGLGGDVAMNRPSRQDRAD